jgi:ElaB/YqjD/DUF883 family membrane-anchored ribosome-binding protein
MVGTNQNNSKDLNKERLGEYASSAIEQGQEKAKETLAELEMQIKHAQDQLNKLTANVDKQLRENPWPIVVGVGLGCLLLGTLLGASKRDH